DALRAAGLDAAALTATDSIAWLLNIRGSDLARTPVVLAFAVVHADASVDLFADPAKFDQAARAHLGPQVRLHAPDALADALARLAGHVGLDRRTAPLWIRGQLAHPVAFDDPCTLPKARKNQAELAGARAAHMRDGAVMAEFLAWLDDAAPHGAL